MKLWACRSTVNKDFAGGNWKSCPVCKSYHLSDSIAVCKSEPIRHECGGFEWAEAGDCLSVESVEQMGLMFGDAIVELLPGEMAEIEFADCAVHQVWEWK